MENINVILIEDNPGDAALVKEFLNQRKSRKEFKLEIYPSLKKGKERLKNGNIDIILLDLSLSDSFGSDTFFKVHDEYQRIPIILLTGTSDNELSEMVLQAGAQDFISKNNLTPTLLEHAIINAIERNKMLLQMKHTSNLLHQNVNLLQNVFNTVPVGIIILDVEGKIVLVNPTVKDTWEVTKMNNGKTIIDNKSWWLETQKLLTLNESIIKAALTKGTIFQNKETEIECLDGSDKTILLSAIPTRADDNVINGAIILQQDITDLKLNEAKLKNINNELNTFIYRASHDLRGPIVTMDGLTRLAKREITDPHSLKYLDMISRSSRRLDHILKTLLDTISIKQSLIVPAVIRFEALVEGIIGKLNNGSEYPSVKIETNIESIKNFKSDRNAITLILSNLIENSIKFRNTEIDGSLITININRYKNLIKIEVIDNGIGISDHLQGKVFDMFYRATNVSQGSGLGLYTTAVSVDKINGKIKLDSKENIGTTVTVHIPDITEIPFETE
jgi:PAS domain S-box-containing protein